MTIGNLLYFLNVLQIGGRRATLRHDDLSLVPGADVHPVADQCEGLVLELPLVAVQVPDRGKRRRGDRRPLGRRACAEHHQRPGHAAWRC